MKETEGKGEAKEPVLSARFDYDDDGVLYGENILIKENTVVQLQ